MNIITLLEQLAHHAHHEKKLDDLLNAYGEQLKIAFQTSSNEFMKKEIGQERCMANPSEIVYIPFI